MSINYELNWLLSSLKLNSENVLTAGFKSALDKEETLALHTLANQNPQDFFKNRAFVNKGTSSLHPSAKSVPWTKVLTNKEQHELIQLCKKYGWSKILDQIS